MHGSIPRGSRVLPALLIAFGTVAALALPAQAATSWSAPVPLPAGCGGPVAVNAAGQQVAAGFQQNADGSMSVQVCTSPDGQTWTGPVVLGQGVSPSVALAPDGRAVVAWEGGPGTAATVAASVLPPGGQWSSPVTLTADFGHPVVAMDGSGNAVAVWAGADGAVETASLPAGGAWTPVTALAPRGQAVDLAVNQAGAAIASWGTRTATVAAAGTVLGGFAAPVTVGPPPPYPVGHTSVVLNGNGDAALAWNGGSTDLVATRTPDGAWAAPVKLSTSADGPIAVAIDGAGNAITVFGQTTVSGSSVTATLSSSRRPAGGTWGPPTVLSVPGDAAVTPVAAADTAGTFAVGWADTTTRTVSVLTSAPGAGFGPAVTFAAAAAVGITMVPGHAVLSLEPAARSNPMDVSSEPVS